MYIYTHTHLDPILHLFALKSFANLHQSLIECIYNFKD